MKKLFCMVIVLVMVLSIVGCSKEKTTEPVSSKTYSISYKNPAELFELELNKDDISNEDIKFKYDELGRIVGCSYQYEDNEIYVNYNYSDSEVQIYAFANDVVADDQKIALTSEYNPDVGFAKYNGYYFKGFLF